MTTENSEKTIQDKKLEQEKVKADIENFLNMECGKVPQPDPEVKAQEDEAYRNSHEGKVRAAQTAEKLKKTAIKLQKSQFWPKLFKAFEKICSASHERMTLANPIAFCAGLLFVGLFLMWIGNPTVNVIENQGLCLLPMRDAPGANSSPEDILEGLKKCGVAFDIDLSELSVASAK